tara:strand:+ start:1361 stop:2845 length:1485 start_codon:yes stop_codon:yes gene_type:complete
MADQGLLGQSKPAGTTNTVLYAAPIDQSASAVLTIANDGTGAAYDVAIKPYDQKLTVDGSGAYKLHKGDVVTAYRFALGTPFPLAANLAAGTKLTSGDGEKTAKFESFYIPPFTEIDVKSVAIRQIAVESTTGTFAVGETISKGTAPNASTAVVYGVLATQGGTNLYIGPSTLNGSGTEFAAGDSITSTGGATATISTGGVGTASNDFVFQPAGTTRFSMYIDDGAVGSGGEGFDMFGDRTYRFDVSDSSMSGLDFSLSTTINGEWGPDGTAGNSDDGAEYTTGRTTNGTAGSSGAYVQYDLSANTSLPAQLYYYEGTTGTAANSGYGGSDRLIGISSTYTYDEIYVYDVDGTWVNSSDTFTFSDVTYTVTGQTSEPYGYVHSYSGTTLTIVKGIGSADFAGSDTFRDVPKSATATRSTVTVSSVDVAVTAVEASNYLAKDIANGNNEIDKITSIVIGPGERLIVESATQNNVFSLVGFQDASTAFPLRVFGAV